MSNPLKDMQKEFEIDKDKYKIGTILYVVNDKITVETEDGVTIDAWGIGTIGDTVIIKGDSVLGRIDKQDTLTANVA